MRISPLIRRTLGIFGKTPEFYEDKVRKIRKNATPSVAMIQTKDKKGNPTGSGTGFFISKEGNFVTNKHVIEGAFSAQIVSERHTVEVAGYYPNQSKLDLIVLKAEEEEDTRFKPLKIADSKQVEFFHRVVAIGYPGGLDSGLYGPIDIGSLDIGPPDVAVGHVNEIRKIPFGVGRATVRMFQFDCRVDFGSSGSPVLNLDGEVVGVVSAKTNVQGINLALPSAYIPIPKDEVIMPLPFGSAAKPSVRETIETTIKTLRPNAKDVLSGLLFIIFTLFSSLREALLSIFVNVWHSIYLLLTSVWRLFF